MMKRLAMTAVMAGAIAALGAGVASAAIGGVGVHTGTNPDGSWDGQGQRPPELQGHSIPMQPGINPDGGLPDSTLPGGFGN